MEEDNLFGEIDDFLNTSTDAYSGTVNNDTNPSNTGPPPPAPSHQIVQVRRGHNLPSISFQDSQNAWQKIDKTNKLP